MLKAYVNYPNPKVSVHGNSSCHQVEKMAKPFQRVVRIDSQSISAQLRGFSEGRYAFAAKQSQNDMWIEADFGDPEFEAAVVDYVHRLIGARYRPLARVEVVRHCS